MLQIIHRLTILTAILLYNVLTFSQSIPGEINYQGILKDASGNLVPNGNYEMSFRIYDSETGGTSLWLETKTINISDGVFSTQLGSINPIDIPFESAYWLGVTIGSNNELTPRIRFTSVPYSHMSMTVPDGSLTSEKISSGQVVKNINGLTDGVNLTAGSNIIITPSGNTLTISGTGGGGGTVTQVNTGSGLTGGPITSTGTISISNNGITSAMLQDNSVSSTKISDGTIVASDIGNNQVVKSINSIKDDVNLLAGSNISITPSGNNITISSTGGSGGIGGSGFSNYLPKFTGTATLGNSIIYENTGNIGIGTTTPEGLLHITRYGDKQLILGHNNQPTREWIFDVDATSKMKLMNENLGTPVTAMTFNSNNGFVGIGDVPLPGSKLDILGGNWDLTSTEGDFRIGNDFYRIKMGISLGGGGIGDAYIGSVGGTNRLFLGAGTTSNNLKTLTLNNNNVGIRMINPLYPLHVESDQLTSAFFTSNSTNAVPRVIQSVYAGTSALDAVAIYGKSVPVNGYGVGAILEGGFYGLVAYATGTSGLTSYAIYGNSSGASTNWAGYFSGNVNVTGSLSKGAGSFKIDHPLDPENKYLYHSFVESPDMKNIYDGTSTTDINGYATVSLPKWFETLNQDFRYQLTVIGEFAQAIIAQEIKDNQFVIRTDKPNVKVSWQVTGIRHDNYANKNRIPVEEYKKGNDIGKYLYPDAYGLPENMGIDYKHKILSTER